MRSWKICDDAELHVVLNEALNGSWEKRLGAACAKIPLVLPHLASMMVIITSTHASRRADLQDQTAGSQMGSSFHLPPRSQTQKIDQRLIILHDGFVSTQQYLCCCSMICMMLVSCGPCTSSSSDIAYLFFFFFFPFLSLPFLLLLLPLLFFPLEEPPFVLPCFAFLLL